MDSSHVPDMTRMIFLVYLFLSYHLSVNANSIQPISVPFFIVTGAPHFFSFFFFYTLFDIPKGLSDRVSDSRRILWLSRCSF